MTIQPFDSIVHALAVLKTGPGNAEVYGDGIRGVLKHSDGDCTIEVVDSLALALNGMQVATAAIGDAAIVIATEVVDATHVRVRTLSAVTGALVPASCSVMVMHRDAPLAGSSAGPVAPPAPTALGVWWDSVDGDDANDGLSDTTPVRTFARVAPFMTQARVRPVLVRTASGDYDVGAGVPSLAGAQYQVCFWADPDWDPRGDLMVEIATGAADVGTTGETCVLPAPVTVNEYEALSLRFLDGPAAGQLRSIAQHPTTAITPALIFNPAPVAGNTFQVFRSGAVLRSSGNRLAYDNPGNGGNNNNAATNAVGVSFVNFDLGFTPDFVQVALGPGAYQLYGIRGASAFGLAAGGSNAITAGISYAANAGPLAVQMGLPQHLWAGWGWMAHHASASIQAFSPSTVFDGFVVTKSSFGMPGRTTVRGGSARILNSFNLPGTYMRVLGPSATLPFQFGATTAINSVINFAVTSAQSGTLHLSNSILRHSGGSSTAILLQGAILLILEPTVTGEQPGTGFTLNVSKGARVFCTGALNLGRAVGTDIAVESAAPINKSALTAAGATSILFDPNFPGSYIRRYA